jgi:predicted O-methyltransferase YrrM
MVAIQDHQVHLSFALKHPVIALKQYSMIKKRNALLSRLLGVDQKEIDGYFEEYQGKADLFRIIEQTLKNEGLDGIAGSDRLIRLPVIYIVTRVLKPQHVVETGLGFGMSTMFFLEALRLNGRGELHTITLPEARYVRDDGRTQDDHYLVKETAIPEYLRKRWHLHFGNTKTDLPKLLDTLGTIDIFQHDSEHTYDIMMSEFRAAWQALRNGGVLLSDDIGWSDAFADFCKEVKGRQASFYVYGAMVKS